MLIVTMFGTNEYRRGHQNDSDRLELFVWCIVAGIPYLNVLIAIAATLFIIATQILSWVDTFTWSDQQGDRIF